MMIQKRQMAFCIVLFLICSGMQAIAADVTLSWDPSTSPGIAGYKIYYGRSSRTYGTPITIGNQTTYIVTGLTDGIWYFSVTAISVKGNESGFSNEVFKTIGTAPPSLITPVPCDINGDKLVSKPDLQALNDIILNKSSASSSHDLNKDGKVNALDLQILSNVLLGTRGCP
jgi:hypothetical protein